MRALCLPVLALLLLPLLCALVLASCGEEESEIRAPGISEPEIAGTIEAFGEHPVAGRKIVLCQLVEEKDAYTTPLSCLLREQVAVSDEAGRFEFFGVGDGLYLFLYDSGLSDFDVGLAEWAGKELRIGDPEWFAIEFLGQESSEVNVKLFSEAANLLFTYGSEAWGEYMGLHMMVGDSPFIVAHDVQKALSENAVSMITARVGEGPQEITFRAISFAK